LVAFLFIVGFGKESLLPSLSFFLFPPPLNPIYPSPTKPQHHLSTFPSKLSQINATVSSMLVSLFSCPFGKTRKMFRKDGDEQWKHYWI